MRIEIRERQCFLVAVAAFSLTLGMHAQTQTSAVGQSPVPAVKVVPYAAIQSVEGRDNFVAYCAVCHGMDGKGDGPAAPAMKAPVPDLTTLAMRHNGKFDSVAVEYIVKGTGKLVTPAHGSSEMPIWGRVFAPLAADQPVATIRIRNLVQYMETIQRTK